MHLNILVIHSPTDAKEVTSFLSQVKEIMSDHSLQCSVYSKSENLDHFNEILENIHVVFVFLTESFCSTHWTNYRSTEGVRQMLVGNGPATLVPIFTVKRTQANFRVPFGLNCLKGLRYCDGDEFYRNSVRKTLTDIIQENNL
jgi:hypothetical protein